MSFGPQYPAAPSDKEAVSSESDFLATLLAVEVTRTLHALVLSPDAKDNCGWMDGRKRPTVDN
jgi:hypothetical protein